MEFISSARDLTAPLLDPPLSNQSAFTLVSLRNAFLTETDAFLAMAPLAPPLMEVTTYGGPGGFAKIQSLENFTIPQKLNRLITQGTGLLLEQLDHLATLTDDAEAAKAELEQLCVFLQKLEALLNFKAQRYPPSDTSQLTFSDKQDQKLLQYVQGLQRELPEMDFSRVPYSDFLKAKRAQYCTMLNLSAVIACELLACIKWPCPFGLLGSLSILTDLICFGYAVGNETNYVPGGSGCEGAYLNCIKALERWEKEQRGEYAFTQPLKELITTKEALRTYLATDAFPQQSMH